MALITPSSLISEISGSVGSECYGRNMGGAYVRSKPTVPYSRTAAQATWRDFLKNTVAAWQALSDSQRAVYESSSIDYFTNSRLGKKQTISGYNLFLRQQMITARTGAAVGFYPPSPILQSTYSCTITALSAVAFSIDFKKYTNQSNTWFSLKASPPLSAGIMHPNPNASQIIISGSLGSGTTSFNALPYYSSKYGAPVSGKRIAIQISSFHSKSGEETEWQMQSRLVA